MAKIVHIIQDLEYGYKRLDPIPDEEEIAEFYKGEYYNLMRKNNHAPDVRKLMACGEEADEERAWLCKSLYPDIFAMIERQIGSRPPRLLDIGCGTGDFMAFMKQAGWDVTGLELCTEAITKATSKGLSIFNLTLEEFYEKDPPKFTVVTMLNVLEHIPNPVALLTLVKSLLIESGIVIIKVPNDFSILQLHAHLSRGGDPWWIAPPEHINYFDFESIQSLLEQLGYEVVSVQGDFPMELFLLMGDDYVGNPEVGKVCHQKRIRYETSLPGEVRRRIYQALATIGVGRDCLIAGIVV